MRIPKIDLSTLMDGGFFARVIKYEFKPDPAASDDDDEMETPLKNAKKPLRKLPKRLKRKKKSKSETKQAKSDEIKSEADDEADEP